MQQVIRFTFLFLLIVTLSLTARAATKESEYKRSDTNYYFKSDVLKAFPNAVIIDAGAYKQKGDSYFITPKGKPAQDIYIQVTNDWVEPITPPTMPASLGVAPDAMEIREPQGDVQMALPSAPANFQPVQDKTVVPNGAVIKTGANGTAAVLMGGVDSIRLIPNSSAAVQQTATAQLRTTEIDLTQGAVFSKVGKRIGEKQDYQVHTPFGVAAARGTDFVTVSLPARTDVWIAQGTVQLSQPDGKTVGTVSSEGTGSLKIIRFPVVPDAQQAMMDSAQTMTAAFDFIPTVNIYVKQLHDKMAQGLKLTPTEQDYLNRIKKVPCLIKLALVAPPAPPPVAPPPPPPPPPAPLAPINVDLREDGKVDFQGATLSLDELKVKLQDVAKATPKQPLIVAGQEKVKPDQLKKVVGICRASKLKTAVAKPAPVVPPPPQPLPTPAATPAPAAAPAPAPATETPPAASPGTIPPPAAPPTNSTSPPTMLMPNNIDLRPNGKVDFKGATYTLDELKAKLDEVAKASPNETMVVTGREKATHGELKKVVAMCHAAKLKVTVEKPAADSTATAKSTTPTTSSSTASTTASSSSNAPAVASSSSTTNSDSAPVKPAKTKAKSSSAQASVSAPISTGPNYTVP